MQRETEIMELSTGIQRILRIDTPPEEQQAEIDAQAAAIGSEVDTVEEGLFVFATSDAAENVRIVISYYQVFLGRLPDAAGLTFWVNGFETGTQTPQNLADAFAVSNEFDELYGNFTVEGVVR